MTTVRTQLSPNSKYDALRSDYATGAAALALSITAIKIARIMSITLHLSAAPTTSENLTATLDSNLGAAYDTLLYSFDLANSSVTDIVLTAEDLGVEYLFVGDQIDIAYTNTDTVTYGIEVRTLELE